MRFRFLFLGAILAVTNMLPASGTHDAPENRQAFESTLSAMPGVRLIAGPRAAIPGFATAEFPGSVSFPLGQPLGDTGVVSFWFRAPRQYLSGLALTPRRQPLVELPGGVTVSFVAEKSSVSLLVLWAGAPVDADRNIRIILPEFPGEEWHHFALTWDVGSQAINVFLDGTPYYGPSGKPVTGSFPPMNRLVVHPSDFALAEVRAVSRKLSLSEVRETVGEPRLGRLDPLLGGRKLVDFDPAGLRGKPLHFTALAEAGETKAWTLEGPGVVSFEDGWMRMRSSRPNGPQGHLVHWLPLELPDRFMAEWEFQLLEEKGLCIVFFAARGKDDRDIFDPALATRTGVFEEYINGEIDCYHISYFAHTPDEPRPVANLRKNRGFYLLTNGPIGVSGGGRAPVHRAALVKDGSRIRMSVDGRTIIDFVDDGVRAGPAWRGGKFGLRQMQWTDARYRNLRISHLVP